MATSAEFKFGDVFDADDPVDQWLTSLSMALNDLVDSNMRLMESLQGDGPAHEHLYGARMVGAQVWEIALLVKAGGDHAVVGTFIAGLAAEAKPEFDAIVSIFDDKEFRAALARARNTFSHYPEIGRKELVTAMTAVKDEPVSALIGKNLAATRLRYADEVAANLFFRRPLTRSRSSATSSRTFAIR